MPDVLHPRTILQKQRHHPPTVPVSRLHDPYTLLPAHSVCGHLKVKKALVRDGLISPSSSIYAASVELVAASGHGTCISADQP